MQLIKTWFLLTFSLLVFFAKAQDHHNHDWCGSNHYLEKQLQENPELIQEYEAVWSIDQIGQYPEYANLRTGARFIIPVVVHVVHANGIGNISFEQIEDGIRVMNEDFRKMNSDTSVTRNLFKPYAADSEIEFRLARIDPDGNCTNGVVRVNNPTLSFDANNAVKQLSFWPSNRYLNVWLVNSIENFSGGNGIVLGYAQFPTSFNWNTFGIVCRHDRYGTIGTSNSDGRTMTHEVGHCLNLFHTFQSGCGNLCQNSGDRVCDTPPSANNTFGCNVNQNTCSNDLNGNSPFSSNMPDQIENYMSYDQCQNMFSNGQKNRMHSVLTNIQNLITLVSQQNLQSTGVLNPIDRVCKADFETPIRVICAGQSITFNDQSFFNPLSHNWTFNGALPANSTDQNPTVVYNQPGVFSVSLTVGGNNDTASTTKNDYILVLPNPGIVSPFIESFEFGSELKDNNWFVNENVPMQWQKIGGSAATGNNAIWVDNYSFGQGSAEIYSPTFDLSNFTSGELTFKVAYAQRTNNNDILRVLFSFDCGQTWVIRFVRGGSSLSGVSPTNAPYFVGSPSEYESYSINIDQNFLVSDFRFQFLFQSAGGNNIFIDDININGTLSDTPDLLYPSNGSINRSESSKLDWKSISACDYYFLEYDTTASFNSPLYFSTQKNYQNNFPNNTDTEHQASGLLHGATYYWRVSGYRNGLEIGMSQTWSFTVANDGVGTQEIEKNKIHVSVYPNPSKGNIFITNLQETNSLSLFDLSGRLLWDKTQLNENMQIELPNTGTYILRAKQKDGSLKHVKVIKL